jgi:phosphocarrier protein
MASEAANELRRAVRIVNQKGLHARASAKFVNAVAGMDDCRVEVCREGNSAGGGSILGLMMLGAARGDTIEIVVAGKDAEARLDMLTALVADGFGES